MSTKKKGKNKFLTYLISIVFFAAALYLLSFAIQEISTTLALRKELAESEKLLAQIRAENIELNDQKTKLEDPEYVKSYARGTYMLSKEGEQIFYLPSSEE